MRVVESRVGGGHRAAVADDDERRPVAGHGRAVAVARWVVEQLRGAIAVGGKPERLRHRHVARRRSTRRARRAARARRRTRRATAITASAAVALPATSTTSSAAAASQAPGSSSGTSSRNAAGVEVGAAQMPAAFARVRHDQPRGARERPVEVPRIHCGRPVSASAGGAGSTGRIVVAGSKDPAPRPGPGRGASWSSRSLTNYSSPPGDQPG